MDHYELVWFADISYLCNLIHLHLGNLKAAFIALVCIIFAPLKVNDSLFRQKSRNSYIYMNFKNGMLMSKDLKQEILLESQGVLEQKKRGN